MKILIVEDDPQDAEWIRSCLTSSFPEATSVHIATEQSFRQSFEEVANDPPDIAIIDLRLRWCDAEPRMSMRPDEVAKGGVKEAGIRCREMLASDDRTTGIDVILYSASAGIDLRQQLHPFDFLPKGPDGSRLTRLVRSIMQAKESSPISQPEVFIVHGHDDAAKNAVALLVTRLGLKPIILHEVASRGDTVIEKFERSSDVQCAIVLLTPDDIGSSTQKAKRQRRARQNVIFEFGFFVAKLGRERVFVLYKEGVELPSDINGLMYIQMDEAGAWQSMLAKEFDAAGFHVDSTSLGFARF